MSGDLKFDIMTMQVEEAMMYMKQHNCTFNSIGYENSEQSTNDLYDNKIIYANYTRPKSSFNAEISKRTLVLTESSFSNKLNNLAENIKLKQSLIAETEYILRNRPIEQTLNCDLKLLIQNIMYVRSSPQQKFYESNVLVIRENSPLATLGFVAQMLCAHNEIIIESTAHTAVLCHIFTTICHEAGLENVKLAFLEVSPPGSNDITELPELKSGCAAVVTGRADIDSALDAIISAPNVYPWHVRRVFVQECVGERFRQGLAWKCGLKGAEAVGSKEYKVSGKLFLHECSTLSNIGDGIVIEEYRTVKELLSLCKENVPLAVSLWCSEVCEANEIAHGIPSSLVWINGLLELSGPPAASQAFYSMLDVTFSSARLLTSKKPSKSEGWSKLSTSERRELISGTLNRENLKKGTDVPELPDGSFAMVDGDLLCIGIQRPVNSAFYTEEWGAENILSAVMAGSTVFDVGQESSDLSNAFRDSGVPVHVVSAGDIELVIPSILSMYRTKVVWTTFGTTFAN